MKLTILSGGQTGVNRAALAWAIRHRMPHGGWCPCGRGSEDGFIPRRYHLHETPSALMDERTLWNVRDSDATAILSLRETLSRGTAQAARFCADLGKPILFLAASIWTPYEAGIVLRSFLARHSIRRLNIAGPRASEQPGVTKFTNAVLDATFHRY